MLRQSSSDSNRRISRQSSQHDCDSEASIDEGTEASRPSNLSSYAEYTESEGDDDGDVKPATNGEKNCENEVRKAKKVLGV